MGRDAVLLTPLRSVAGVKLSRGRIIGLAAATLAIAACIYRILTFAPQELDDPNTFRPLVVAFFSKFLSGYPNPVSAAIVWRKCCLLLLLLPIAIAALNCWQPTGLKSRALSKITKLLCSRPVFLAAIFLPILVTRAPALLLGELNPDESQFIASAQKLFKDPVFFRSVDTGTVGPGDIYPLMLPGLFHQTPDYASSRLIGLFILCLSLWALYSAFSVIATDRIARFAILPLSGIFAVLHYGELQQYNSEVPSLLILSLAIYMALRFIANSLPARLAFAILGLLSGLSFFAKMQSLPLLLAVGAVSFGYSLATKRSNQLVPLFGLFAAGAALPFVLVAASCLATGVWGDFWTSYIDGNRAYVGQTGGVGQPGAVFISFLLLTDEARYFSFTFIALLGAYLLRTSRTLRGLKRGDTMFLSLAIGGAAVFAILTFLYNANGVDKYIYLVLFGIIVAPIYFALRFLQSHFQLDRLGWLGVLASLLMVSSACAIYVANNHFPHYVMLLFIPVGLGMANLLFLNYPDRILVRPGERLPSLRPPVHAFWSPAFLLVFLALNLATQTFLLPDINYYRDCFRAARTIPSPEGDFIRSVTQPGDPIVIWGWNAALYIASRRLPATRDTNMRNFFRSSPQINAYYRRRFIRDAQRNPPILFVDSAVPKMLMNDNNRFEMVPEVKQFVESQYTLIKTDADGRRYYLRTAGPGARPYRSQ